MSLHTAFSWPYGDSENETRAFYQRLKAGHAAGHEFPFSRYQVALCRGSYTWFVAVLVLTETAGDDSLYIHGRSEEWFAKCGGGGYQDYETIPLRGASIESSIGAEYDILESFGTLGGGSSSSSSFRPTSRSTTSSTAQTRAAPASASNCPRCGAENFNVECSSCGYVEWQTVAICTAVGVLLIAPALFWFQSLYWRIPLGLLGGFLLLVPLIVSIGWIRRRANLRAAQRRERMDTVRENSPASTPDTAQTAGPQRSTSHEADVEALAAVRGDELAPEVNEPAPNIVVTSRRKLEGHRNVVKFLAFTPDSRTLISAEAAWEAKLILWDAAEGRLMRTLDVGDFVEGLCLSSDGKTLVVYSQSKRVYAFRLPDGDPIVEFDPYGEFISAVALSRDGRFVATGGSYTAMHPKLWSLPEATLVHTFPKAVQTRALQFSPNGRSLVAATEGEPLTIWSVPDGKLIRALAKEVSDVYTNGLGLSADGDVLVTGDGNNKIRFIKTSGWQLMSTAKAHTYHYPLAFSPDRKMVAVSGEDNSAVVWRVFDGRKMCEVKGHTETGLHLALSDEPRVLISSGTHMGSKKDRSVRLSSVPHGKPIAVLKDLRQPPHAVAISPDGRFAAFAPDSGPLQLLELEVQSSAS